MKQSAPPLDSPSDNALIPGALLHGFRVQRVSELPDIRCRALELTHEKSGARLIHLLADDPENLISIGFRTPPQDDTGLPHILEHTVLCGSRSYPVKDPFVELLKTSMASFLNAMTYPDKTVYPCASMNEKDFFHLAGVYCDAVFHPLMTEQHFKQEGHHREFADITDPDSPLIVKGIVYNEMKGAYSTLDGTLGREGRRLFPDNAYGFDSGGDPQAIPELTYEDFTAFHRRFYHPSNAFIFLYGNIPTETHLAFLDQNYLSSFDRIDIDTSITDQPRWTEPRSETVPYPAAADETPDKKSAVLIEYLANSVTDAETFLAMDILGDYLLGNAASPLRKALIDSKLGEDLTWAGYSAYRRDTSFVVGLKGTGADKADAIVDLVESTCAGIADAGLDASKLEASLHQFDLDARGIPEQYPLHLMDRVYNSWIYDADPLILLEPSRHIAALRRRYAEEPGYFEGLLRRYIVDNPHRLVLTAVPDAGLSARKDAVFAEVMNEVKAGLSEEEKQRLVQEAGTLVEMQNTPNTDEALATLPRLGLQDVGKDPVDYAVLAGVAGSAPLLRPEVFANRLSFVDLAFDMRGLEKELIDDLPVFCSALARMGAGGLDYAALAEAESKVCAGMSASAAALGQVENPAVGYPYLFLAVHGLEENSEAFLDIMNMRLCEADFSDRNRLKDILVQGAVRWRNAIIPRGNLYAARYAQRTLSGHADLGERLAGFSQLRHVRDLADHFEEQVEALLERFERIRAYLLKQAPVQGACTAGDTAFAGFQAWLNTLSGSLGKSAKPPLDEETDVKPLQGLRTGIAMPADVAFVAKAMKAVSFTDPHAPALSLIGMQLSYGYLWNEVRVKGGAYGCGARLDAALGIFLFSSYRDPSILRTLGVYDGVFEYIQNHMPLDEASVEQYIIGTLKTLDRPIRPGGTSHEALARTIMGSTPALRRSFRDRLLALGAADIRAAVDEVLVPAFEQGPVCVLSSRERLEEAHEQADGLTLAIEDL